MVSFVQREARGREKEKERERKKDRLLERDCPKTKKRRFSGSRTANYLIDLFRGQYHDYLVPSFLRKLPSSEPSRAESSRVEPNLAEPRANKNVNCRGFATAASFHSTTESSGFPRVLCTQRWVTLWKKGWYWYREISETSLSLSLFLFSFCKDCMIYNVIQWETVSKKVRRMRTLM